MIPNHSLGVRIKYYRQEKGYTQKQLGEFVGVGDSTIRNYELGKRIPDERILLNIAEALEVDFYTLYPPVSVGPNAAIQALFEFEHTYDLVPTMHDGKIVLEVSEGSDNGKQLSQYIERWYKAYCSLKNNQIDEDMYDKWQNGFPCFSYFDENGTPIVGANVNPEYKPNTERTIEDDYEIYILTNKWAGMDQLMSLEEYKEFRKKNDKK